MSNFRDKLKQSGYDAEEAYFYKREQELIEKMRADQKRPQLTLLQGGKQDDPPKLPQGRPIKKAA